MHGYDRIAEWYAETRSLEGGVLEVETFVHALPRGARVLDLGCGHGLPLSRVLMEHDLEVAAIDSSPETVTRYQANVPGVPVQGERVQEARFPAESFDGVVAWGVLFHLPADDQRSVLEGVATWLAPGGRFLFTSGDLEGEIDGTMDGVAFHYVSLGVSGYRRALADAGMHLLRHHNDARDNHVYVARNLR